MKVFDHFALNGHSKMHWPNLNKVLNTKNIPLKCNQPFVSAVRHTTCFTINFK